MRRSAQITAAAFALAWLPVISVMGQANEQTEFDIWTTGPLLKAVQLAPLYNDSKTFVDMPALTSPSSIQANFAALTADTNGTLAVEDLQEFVNQHFGVAGSDFTRYEPADYSPDGPPEFLPLVTDPAIRQWALEVNALWPYLSRIETPSVAEQPSWHSLLTLPEPGVVAGDRFREIYYWDTYWIIQGLLVCGMNTTAQDMVTDLLHLAVEYGHVPNGARTYYINRSQPPLLSQMVVLLYNTSKDTALLETALPVLEADYKYWTTAPKAVPVDIGQGKTFNFSRYYANWTMPRPESFLEDWTTASFLNPTTQQTERQELWRNLASGAESGWDFSSRWFAPGGDEATIRVTDILPSDLNAYLYQMESNLAYLNEEVGNTSASSRFLSAAEARRDAMNAVMYNADQGRWTDMLIESRNAQGVATVTVATEAPYVSNYIPLWAGLLDDQPQEALAVVDSFYHSGLIQDAGIVTSLNDSGQQWDYPNAWAPLQSMMVDALLQHGGNEGERVARSLVQAWLGNNYAGWQAIDKMVEKYNAITSGEVGGGGEYSVQTGFGWTNGVMLNFLERFGWNPDIAPVPAVAPQAASSAR
ncbi:hypothetical protein WJX73_003834 [Symbiochloris irregularis]|uniref:Trehalase n=1 Tax=Symbiochloris irregularis TaxID=706552 RepID=A0AAW1PB26_9CHLO